MSASWHRVCCRCQDVPCYDLVPCSPVGSPCEDVGATTIRTCHPLTVGQFYLLTNGYCYQATTAANNTGAVPISIDCGPFASCLLCCPTCETCDDRRQTTIRLTFSGVDAAAEACGCLDCDPASATNLQVSSANLDGVYTFSNSAGLDACDDSIRQEQIPVDLSTQAGDADCGLIPDQTIEKVRIEWGLSSGLVWTIKVTDTISLLHEWRFFEATKSVTAATCFDTFTVSNTTDVCDCDWGTLIETSGGQVTVEFFDDPDC